MVARRESPTLQGLVRRSAQRAWAVMPGRTSLTSTSTLKVKYTAYCNVRILLPTSRSHQGVNSCIPLSSSSSLISRDSDRLCHLVASALPGSDEERAAFVKANHQNKLLQQQENQGLHLTIKVGADMRKGCDFDVFAVVTNNTQSVKKCRLVFGSCAVSYNGILGGNCGFKDLLNVELSPGAGEPSLHVVVPKNYMLFIGSISCILLYCIASSREESPTKAELLKVW